MVGSLCWSEPALSESASAGSADAVESKGAGAQGALVRTGAIGSSGNGTSSTSSAVAAESAAMRAADRCFSSRINRHAVTLITSATISETTVIPRRRISIVISHSPRLQAGDPSAQSKLDAHFDDDIHRHALHAAGCEAPLTHRVHRALVQPAAQPANNLHLADGAVAADDDLELHFAFDVGAARFVGVIGAHFAQQPRRFNTAARAEG